MSVASSSGYHVVTFKETTRMLRHGETGISVTIPFMFLLLCGVITGQDEKKEDFLLSWGPLGLYEALPVSGDA